MAKYYENQCMTKISHKVMALIILLRWVFVDLDIGQYYQPPVPPLAKGEISLVIKTIDVMISSRLFFVIENILERKFFTIKQSSFILIPSFGHKNDPFKDIPVNYL